jgi:hypothetical protein
VRMALIKRAMRQVDFEISQIQPRSDFIFEIALYSVV